MAQKAVSHEDLVVYQRAFELAMELFERSREFPRGERYSLTDQMLRSSRSICANLAEAWRKRRYRAYFLSKLTDVQSELAETQTWIRFAERCGYLASSEAQALHGAYTGLARTLTNMILHVDDWLLPPV